MAAWVEALGRESRPRRLEKPSHIQLRLSSTVAGKSFPIDVSLWITLEGKWKHYIILKLLLLSCTSWMCPPSFLSFCMCVYQRNHYSRLNEGKELLHHGPSPGPLCSLSPVLPASPNPQATIYRLCSSLCDPWTFIYMEGYSVCFYFVCLPTVSIMTLRYMLLRFTGGHPMWQVSIGELVHLYSVCCTGTSVLAFVIRLVTY